MPSVVSTWDYPDAVRAFVEDGLWGGAEQFSEASQGLGFVRENEGLVAGIVYHNWSPRGGTIEISAYSACRDWLTKASLLRPGNPTAPRSDYLRLLPSGSDLVRRLLPRRTQQSALPGCLHLEIFGDGN